MAAGSWAAVFVQSQPKCKDYRLLTKIRSKCLYSCPRNPFSKGSELPRAAVRKEHVSTQKGS